MTFAELQASAETFIEVGNRFEALCKKNGIKPLDEPKMPTQEPSGEL